MRSLAYILLIVLFVLHQRAWLWESRTLVFGFLHEGMAYHALYSLVTAALWVFVIKVLWPSHIECWADEEVGGE